MRVRTSLVVLAAAAALAACGDDTSQKSNNQNNMPSDTGLDGGGVEDTGDVVDTGGGDDAGGGGDTGGGEDAGGGDMGSDMAGGDMGSDMAGGDMGSDMAGGDMGSDMAGGDMGSDMAGGDMGSDMGADMGADAGMPEPVAFRMSNLELRDPHAYANIFNSCTDATSGLFGFGVNDQLEAAIQEDGDGDLLLDLSFLLIFDPLDQTDLATGMLTVAEADCTAPMSSTMCTVDTTVHTVEDSTYTNDFQNDCLDVIPNTTNPSYSPAVSASGPPCFYSMSVDLTVGVSGIQIPLTDVQVAATYSGNPATGLTDGLLRGFVSEATADSIVLPDTLDFIGGQTLSQLLPGGDPPDSGDACADDGDCNGAGETCEGGSCEALPNCATHDDRDMNNGVSGWWFYFNYPATQVPYTMQ